MPTHLSWSEVESLARTLVAKLEPGRFNRILAVARGGLPVATLVSHLTGIKALDYIQVASTAPNGERHAIKLLHTPAHAPDANTLILDEMYDTGITVTYLAQQYPNSQVAVLINKHATPPAHLLYAADYPPESQPVFPWEVAPHR